MTLGAGNVDWMDVYHCEKEWADRYICAAFQPDWRAGKRDEGYPRFGPNEAKSGEFSYMLLTGSSSTALAYGWDNIQAAGSATLAAGAAIAATMALLEF